MIELSCNANTIPGRKTRIQSSSNSEIGDSIKISNMTVEGVVPTITDRDLL